MKAIIRSFAAALLAGLAAAAPASAEIANQDGVCVVGFDEEFLEIIPEIAQLSDPYTFAEAANDPETFFELLAAMNNPLAARLMAKCATEPALWEHWVSVGSDPEHLAKSAALMMDPIGLAKWAMAPFNPAVWSLAFSQLDPQRYVDWANALTTGEFWETYLAFANPSWIARRMAWFANPESFAPILERIGFAKGAVYPFPAQQQH